jgi:single-strand DNA-binding protein
MRDLNKVMLIGNLTRDPELKSIPSGQTVASFTVAANRSWNDASGELQKAVEYVDIVAWGKLAEVVGQILKKGRRTFVEGRLQTRSWEAQDGTKRYKTEVVASDIIVLDRPDNLNSSPVSSFSTDNTEQKPPQPQPEKEEKKIEKEEVDIEDIPF